MASIPLNTFKTQTLTAVPTSPTRVYFAPLGVTSIILYAQVATTGTNSIGCTFYHRRPGNPAVITYLLNGGMVPPNDSLQLVNGKLVLQTYDEIWVTADSNSPGSHLDFIASILETANQ